MKYLLVLLLGTVLITAGCVNQNNDVTLTQTSSQTPMTILTNTSQTTAVSTHPHRLTKLQIWSYYLAAILRTDSKWITRQIGHIKKGILVGTWLTISQALMRNLTLLFIWTIVQDLETITIH